MRTFAAVLATLVLSACSTVGLGGAGGGRMELWRQAHHAFSIDSFRVAEALFQRLATEHPRTYEGHEARFYLGVLNLEPRNQVDFAAAIQNLSAYLAEDTTGEHRGYHHREGETLLTFARLLNTPCGRRVPSILCPPPPLDTGVVVTRPAPGQPEPPQPTGAISAAEAARLRRTIADQAATITQLQNELQRIRNTLAPRPD